MVLHGNSQVETAQNLLTEGPPGGGVVSNPLTITAPPILKELALQAECRVIDRPEDNAADDFLIPHPPPPPTQCAVLHHGQLPIVETSTGLHS